MSRVVTSNYGAVATTQFAWATTDDDIFDREDDLYNLAQAVENHDHSSGRGLSVARVSANAVGATALQALSVGTSALANLSVTNDKLAAGVVTYDKITWPLIQSANSITGGIRLRETTNVYEVGFYIATNGLAVFSAGVVGNAGAGGLILGQTGNVSVGTAAGAARLNVMQAVDGSTTLASGLRIYNPTITFFDDIVNYGGHLGIFAQGVGALWVDSTNKYITLGTAVSGVARLAIISASDAAAEGVRIIRGSAYAEMYVFAEGSLYFGATGKNIRLNYSNNTLEPVTNQGLGLGRSGQAWGDSVFGAVSCGNVTCGTITSGAVACGSIQAPSATIAGAISANLFSGVNVSISGDFNGANITVTTQGYKPGGGSWAASSDIRTKFKSKFRPYTSGLDVVLKLDPVWYTYNGDYGTPRGAEYAGFKAEDLQTLAPEMVTSRKLRRQSEEDPEEDILAVDMSNLPLMLVRAMQELASRVEALEAERKN